MKQFLSKLLGSLMGYLNSYFNKERLLQYLKDKTVKNVAVRLLGSAALGGFRVWLVTFVVNNLFDKFAEPIIELGLRKVGVLYKRVDGKLQISRLENVDQQGDEDAYDDIITDILS